MNSLDKMSIDDLSVYTIRTLAMDAVQRADSGHPGTPMALAPLAYVLSKEKSDTPQIVLIASGSEVQFILAAQEKLAADGIQARVVSMPSWELFLAQTRNYRDEVLTPKVKVRLAVEAGAPLGWREWVGDAGEIIGIAKYGASAPYKENFKHYGFTVENVVSQSRELLEKIQKPAAHQLL